MVLLLQGRISCKAISKSYNALPIILSFFLDNFLLDFAYSSLLFFMLRTFFLNTYLLTHAHTEYILPFLWILCLHPQLKLVIRYSLNLKVLDLQIWGWSPRFLLNQIWPILKPPEAISPGTSKAQWSPKSVWIDYAWNLVSVRDLGTLPMQVAPAVTASACIQCLLPFLFISSLLSPLHSHKCWL